MAIIILDNILLNYGERTLFDHLSVQFQEDQKVGLVGRNGAGKSTLLSAIAAQVPLDEGAIVCDKNKKIAFLPQEVVLNSTQSIFDEIFTVFEQYTTLEDRQNELEQALADNPTDAELLMQEYQQVLDELDHFNRGDAERRAKAILLGLGFKEDQFDKPVSELSVGWKMRIVLAKLLLEQADYYLFDEPTNHLDMATKEWFLDFLRNAPFGYLLVTHDRYFLDNACDWIYELSRGNGTLYNGNYTKYLRQYEERRASLLTAQKQQQKEITRKEATIARFKASASKAKMAQSMMKQLDKVERIEIEPAEPVISLSFPQLQRAGDVVLTAKDLSYQFGNKKLFSNASCQILRNQKVALVAPNGVGKSTLFSLIAGKLPLQTGSVSFGHNVTYALFEQDQTKVLDPNKTILQEVTDGCPSASLQQIRAFLGSFLFTGDDVYKKTGVLSGGEKNRVAMVKVLLQNANLLLLDEPTNHLDLYAKSVLLQALQQYKGTLLFVSHDHQFIQELATDILHLTPNGLYYYPGNYEQFLADQKMKQDSLQNLESNKVEMQKSTAQQPIKTVLSKEQRKTIAALEKQIQKVEKKLAQETERLSLHAYGTSPYKQAVGVVSGLQAELDTLVAEWEQLVDI